MCFSATASFVTAGVVSAIGLACLSKTESPREWPLAGMPILFGLHQTVEGLLWLTLPEAPDGASASLLTILFLVQAKVLWPAYAPLAALLVESQRRKRWLMYPILAAGTVAGAYFLRSILTGSHTAEIAAGHIVYRSDSLPPTSVSAMYMLAAFAPAALSSHVAVRLFAGIVTLGAWITYAYYWESFTSVWCYFAAAASMVVFLHFVDVKRQRLALRARTTYGLRGDRLRLGDRRCASPARGSGRERHRRHRPASGHRRCARP